MNLLSYQYASTKGPAIGDLMDLFDFSGGN
jgi:hypothetical protein